MHVCTTGDGMTRTAYLRQHFLAVSDALSPETRKAVLRHYDERIAAEWLACRYFMQEAWGWN